MKSIFFIHSHTLFLTSLGVIEYLEIPADEIVFFYARNYKNTLFNIPYKVIDITSLYSSLQVNNHKKIWRNKHFRKQKIMEIDNLLYDACGDSKFRAFVPHMAFSLFKIVSTNKLCNSISYIQEGGVPFTMAYSCRFDLLHTVYHWIYNRFIASPRLKYTGRWYDPTLLTRQLKIDSYSISDTFFKHLPSNNHIVKWPNIDVSFPYTFDTPIFVFDGFIKNNHIESDYYLEMCEKLISNESKDNNYIKFHPVQDIREKLFILNCFKNRGKKYSIIQDDIPLEVVISSCSHLRFVGFGSSLLYFAKDYGHDVVCKDIWLKNSKLYMNYKNETGFMWFIDAYGD